MSKISIIMPVYNGESFLSNTVNQILAQDFDEYELIIVDDGSVDKSFEICNEFAIKDFRIKVIQQKNKGISAARNRGLKEATGKYIAFMDQDDEITTKWLKIMYEAAESNMTDITRVGYRIIEVDQNNNMIAKFDSVTKTEIINKSNLLNEFSLFRDHFQSVWNCLYKKDLIEYSQVKFNEEMRFGGEDITFNIMLFPFINRVAKISDVEYIHYKRKNTSTSVKFNQNRIDSILMLNSIEISIISNIYKGQDKNKWMISESTANLCLLISLICKSGSLTMNEKKEYLKKLRIESTLKQYKIDINTALFLINKYVKRYIAGYLFKFKMWNLLIKLGEKRVGEKI